MMAAAVLAIAAPAWAGSGEKCSAANAQDCLSHYSAMRTKGWVGLDLDKANKEAMVVTGVTAGSPAAKAGFKTGDILVALNGAKFSDYEAVKAAKGAWTPGAKVSYTVKRGSSEKQLEVTLAKMPEEVFARMIGAHMIEEHMAALDAASVDSKD
jgi:predicted metalloprotease with PDZ domain